MRSNDVGLIVGRFQIFHKAHLELVKYLSDCVDEVVIGLGSAQYDYLHPRPNDLRVRYCLTLEERTQLVKGCTKGFPTRIVPLRDYPTDEEWVRHVIKEAGKFDYLMTEKKDEMEQFQGYCRIIKWPGSSSIRNGTVINEILAGNDYRQLVPEYGHSFLEEKNIRNRLIQLNKIDLRTYGTYENFLLQTKQLRSDQSGNKQSGNYPLESHKQLNEQSNPATRALNAEE